MSKIKVTLSLNGKEMLTTISYDSDDGLILEMKDEMDYRNHSRVYLSLSQAKELAELILKTIKDNAD